MMRGKRERCGMIMSEFEIVADFKSALNKNKQIGILSDLNDCKPDDIMEILKRHNAIQGMPKTAETNDVKPKVKKAPNTKWTSELDAEVSKLASEGHTIAEIAEWLGMNAQAIYDRRRSLSKTIGGVVKKTKKNIEKGTEKAMNNAATKGMPDIRDVARNLTDVFDVMGYGLSAFNFDVLSGTISIVAKEKTADGGTSNGQV
jgi:hypothetical protein